MDQIIIKEFTGADASVALDSPIINLKSFKFFAVNLYQTGFTNDLSTLTILGSNDTDLATFQILQPAATPATLTMLLADKAQVIEYQAPMLYDKIIIRYTPNGNTGGIDKMIVTKLENTL